MKSKKKQSSLIQKAVTVVEYLIKQPTFWIRKILTSTKMNQMWSKSKKMKLLYHLEAQLKATETVKRAGIHNR